MKPAVPDRAVMPEASAARATPKSITCGPSSASKMFDGFRSRWIEPGGVDGAQRFGHASAHHPHVVGGEGLLLAENLLKRRPGDVGGHHPGPFGVRVGVDDLRGVESADLAAGLDL